MITRLLRNKYGWVITLVLYSVPGTIVTMVPILPLFGRWAALIQIYLIMPLLLCMYIIVMGLNVKPYQKNPFKQKRFISNWFFLFFLFSAFSTLTGIFGDPAELFASAVMKLGIVLLALYGTFATFYCFLFTAKTIRSAELGRIAVLHEYLGLLVIILFYPVGLTVMLYRVSSFLHSTTSQKGSLNN